MDATKIRRALADVHLSEKTSSNPNGISRAKAVRNAIKTHNLSPDERGVLLNATLVSVEELESQK